MYIGDALSKNIVVFLVLSQNRHLSKHATVYFIGWEFAGGGVSSVLYKYFKDATKYLVDYCGCVELRRQIMDNDGFGESADFEVVTSHGVAFKNNKAPIHGPLIIQSPI